MNDIRIDHFSIGKSHKPFVIAEMSGNHNQSIVKAISIIDAAAAAGAHAVKLQTYTPDTITMKGALTISDSKSLWKGEELYDLYQKAYTPWEWHAALFERAREKGIIIFSSPFDTTAVNFLETLNAPAYKIASFENTDWILLKRVAQTGKPVIMSTGVATLADIDESVRVLRANGCKELILLKCTSTYPSSPANSNIVTIPHLEKTFNCITGISDHSMGIGVSTAAVALGARVIEKHFTISRAEGGVDSAFSMEPHEFKMLVESTEQAFLALGEIQMNVQEAEKDSLNYKRSLYVSEDIKEGGLFSEKNIRSVRPALGLHTKYFDVIIGKKAKKNIKKGTPLNWDIIS